MDIQAEEGLHLSHGSEVRRGKAWSRKSKGGGERWVSVMNWMCLVILMVTLDHVEINRLISTSEMIQLSYYNMSSSLIYPEHYWHSLPLVSQQNLTAMNAMNKLNNKFDILCWLNVFFSLQFLSLKVLLSINMNWFLIIGLLYTWLTLVGLHVEVAAGGGGRGGRGCGRRRRRGRAITGPGALDHTALGGRCSMAVAGGWATVAAGWQAERCGGNSRLHLTSLLLHGGMAGAWRHTRTVRAASTRCHVAPYHVNHRPTFSSSLQEARVAVRGWTRVD